MALLENDVEIERALTVDPVIAAAVGDEVRAALLDLLADEARTVSDLVEGLAGRGYEKAETTVRHHVKALVDADLARVARMEEAGGGTRKFYRATARRYPCRVPDDVDLDPEVAATRRGMASIVAQLLENFGDEIDAAAAGLVGGDHLPAERRRAFVVRHLVDRALTDIEEDPEGPYAE